MTPVPSPAVPAASRRHARGRAGARAPSASSPASAWTCRRSRASSASRGRRCIAGFGRASCCSARCSPRSPSSAWRRSARASRGHGARALLETLRPLQPRARRHARDARAARPGAGARAADPHLERRASCSRASSRAIERLIDAEVQAGHFVPTVAAGRARLRDRAARRGVPLQRRDRRASAATPSACARSRRRCSASSEP